MNFLTSDHNGFLCTTLDSDNRKTYSIAAGGQVREAVDHTMLVWHKEQLKEIAWKDLGNTMQLIRLIPHMLDQINENNDMSDTFIASFLSGFGLYTGYDENTDQHYFYLPKITGEKLDTILHQAADFLHQETFQTIDTSKGWFSFAHSGSLSDEEQKKYCLAQFLGIALIYGKALIVKDTLTAYKIQVPAHSYAIIEKLDLLTQQLREKFFVISSQYKDDQKVYEITTSDYDLLAYLRILYGENMNVLLKDKMLDLSPEICIHYAVSPEQKAMRWKMYEVKR